MARVVHRRKAPPYALIIFVFLFLVAAALAIIAYNNLHDAREERAAVSDILELLAGRQTGQGQYPQLKVGLAADLYSDRKTELQNARKTDPKATVKVPVLAELMDREKKLREMISSQAATKDAAETEVTALRKSINDHGPLLDIIKKLQTQLGQRDSNVAGLQKRLDQAEQTRKTFEDQAGRLATQLKTVTAQKDGEIEKLDNALKAYQAEQTQKLQEAQQKWDDDRTEKDKQIAKLSEQVARQTKEIGDLKIKLEIEIKRSRPRPETPAIVTPALQPDGKVLRVLQGEDVCYIDIGSKDRVVPGLTFSVYPAGKGPHTDTPPKGNLTVTRVVDRGLSECRIDKIVNPEAPVVANDAIANVAFDATRQYSFVVEGQFDLYGGGRPSLLGTNEVKRLVKKFGGEVADQLTTQTDFVIMGTAPPLPGKPKDEAEDSEKVVYEEQMKIYNKYRDVRDNAVRMRIPVLNTHRFLGLVGYTPARTLR